VEKERWQRTLTATPHRFCTSWHSDTVALPPSEISTAVVHCLMHEEVTCALAPVSISVPVAHLLIRESAIETLVPFSAVRTPENWN
jgi:hypothetical protein